ncbi:MAG: sialate O-acetylesterase, partial [Muribaculaceae bacterium]|nr:sialate O-acetylesterase [Muribaculaceae bacterium]
MIRFITFIFTLVVLVPMSLPIRSQIRVACVGNSITYGTGSDDPATMSWPSQMRQILGPEYIVENFGRPGATLLKHGHNPYVASPEFRRALEFKPDIVVVHLGVNDTDPRDWPEYGDEFVSDYVALIDSFRSVSPDARILVARLSPITSGHRRFRSGTYVWRNKVTEAIEAVAEAAGAELIDFDEPLRDHRGLISDAVHPDARGYTLLARAVAGAVTGRYGGLSMPEIWQSGMVLQRYKPLKVSGRADAGACVAVEVDGTRAEAVADNLGHWTATLPPLSEATGLTMTVSDDRGGRLVFDDVSVGEVWLASGQSNMAFELCNSTTYGEDTLSVADCRLRLFDMKPRVITDWNEWPDADKAAVDTLNYYRPSRWRQSSAATAGDFSAVAWHFGRMLRDSLDVPVGIICNAIGGSGTEAWIDVDMLEERMPEVLVDWRSNDYLQPWVQQRARENTGSDGTHRHPYEPSYLFASGIRPLGAYPIAGVIWYQGESNAHNAEVHEQLFEALVDSWRRNWDEARLPFIFTQLSSLSRPSWPSFRDSQRRLLDTTGATGMAVSSDFGDSLDVHPRHKRPVGQRLARWALNRVYGHAGVTPSGPLPVEARCIAPGTVELTMKYAHGLCTSDGAPIRTFEVAHTDGL